MPATGPKADLAPRPSGEAATLEAGQATHGATTGAVPEVPLAEAMALLNLPSSRGYRKPVRTLSTLSA